jgi:four helix bundle protein
LIGTFPKHELYGLASQILRDAVSIPSIIAKGHERDSTKEFLRQLSIAHGSRAELETQLFISQQLGYAGRDVIATLVSRLEEVGKMLRAMQKSLKAKL